MKVLPLILILLIFTNCAKRILADAEIGNLPTPTPTAVDSNTSVNANSFPKVEAARDGVNEAEREAIELQNSKYREPDEDFKAFDFENFSYPFRYNHNNKDVFFKLQNGKLEFDSADDRGWVSLSETLYVDVTGDGKKEAIILLWHVSCGGSCDGGSALFYIYTLENKKPKLIWQYGTGSLAYGDGLKSFVIKNDSFEIEKFMKCVPDSPENSSPATMTCGKFETQNVVRDSFRYDGEKFVTISSKIIETPITEVKNYSPLVKVEK